jgi:hypothetical protein
MTSQPVVFINGTPYVLREARRPLANLLECAPLHLPLLFVNPHFFCTDAGIDGARVEHFEERLKADVLAELAEHGTVVVTRELHDGCLAECCLSAGCSVQSPREVFASLAEDFAVNYLRLPCSPFRVLRARDLGTPPLPADASA